MKERYNYKAPRRLNWVSVLIILGLLAMAYAGWKFGPAYWKGYKVDEVLSDYRNRASDLPGLSPQFQSAEADRIKGEVYQRLQELGIGDTEEQPLEVDFGPNFSYLYARYQIIVKHPFGKTTTMKFLRKQSIPKARNL
jgi:hypothetical protein